jgi:hypothetical protein
LSNLSGSIADREPFHASANRFAVKSNSATAMFS